VEQVLKLWRLNFKVHHNLEPNETIQCNSGHNREPYMTEAVNFFSKWSCRALTHYTDMIHHNEFSHITCDFRSWRVLTRYTDTIYHNEFSHIIWDFKAVAWRMRLQWQLPSMWKQQKMWSWTCDSMKACHYRSKIYTPIIRTFTSPYHGNWTFYVSDAELKDQQSF
jgi:hypothetical protein